MTDRSASRVPAEVRLATASAGERDDALERSFGRSVALALPAASIVCAIAVGSLASVGSGLLVLAAGALLGAIAMLWASVRTLTGEAPLATGFETMAAETAQVDALVEEKRRLLRGLKDIENEHEIGKINDADYQSLLARYRHEAKAVMRKMDGRVAPFRDEAERLAREYLKKCGLGSAAFPEKVKGPTTLTERVVCGQCSASNEPDAAFCKQCGSLLKKEQGGAQA